MIRKRNTVNLWEVTPMQDSDTVIIRCGNEELTLTGTKFKTREQKIQRAIEIADALNGGELPHEEEIAGFAVNHATGDVTPLTKDQITNDLKSVLGDTLPMLDIMIKFGEALVAAIGHPGLLTDNDVVGELVKDHEAAFIKAIEEKFSISFEEKEHAALLTMTVEEFMRYMKEKTEKDRS